jgi:hypothetical protein
MANLRIATNRNLYNAIESLVCWIDGEQVGGASLTLYPTPRMQVSAYDQTREILFDVANMPADLWEQAELLLRLLLSAQIEDRRAA